MIRGRSVIGTLRQRGADDGRARTALGTVALRPEGLPADAVLVVRRLADPLPGRLGRTSDTSAWQHAAVDSLMRARDRAARPAAGPVPAGAEAVLFDDWAQLLAALADDWLSGQLTGRWWWREFLRTASPQQAVVRAWRGAAREMPVALDLLARRQRATTFAARMTGPEAASLTAEMAHAWGAPASAVSILARPSPPSASDVKSPTSRSWTRTAPEAVAPDLPGEARMLLGVGLTLARTPAVAAGARFWDDVVRELAAPPPSASARQTSAATPGTRGRTARPDLGEAAVQAEAKTVPGAEIAGRDLPAAPPRMTRAPAAIGSTDAPAARSVSRVHADAGAPPVWSAAGVGARARVAPPPTPAAAAVPVQDGASLREGAAPEKRDPLDAPDTVVVSDLQIHTGLGGLLFLLNHAVDEGLYADFTRPATPGLRISPWDLLPLVGPVLLAADERGDPVWPLLASLAGTEGAPRVPRATRRWARRLSGRWQATLAQRLECAPAAAGPLLIRLPARIRVTALRVDAAYDLAALPLAVRMAGLDRDPGWFPACGRSIGFGFE